MTDDRGILITATTDEVKTFDFEKQRRMLEIIAEMERRGELPEGTKIIIAAPTGVPAKILREKYPELQSRIEFMSYADAELGGKRAHVVIIDEPSFGIDPTDRMKRSQELLDECKMVEHSFGIDPTDRLKRSQELLVEYKMVERTPDPTDDFVLDRKKRKDWKSPYDRRRR